jgi:SAM-dependent methyltransferase
MQAALATGHQTGTDDIPEQQIYNGQPSFHAALMAKAAVRDGEHVVHVGAGLGYYSATFAELVGNTGQVTAIEYVPELAARAKTNLQPLSNVELLQGDGAATPFREADVIYVNAGATRARLPGQLHIKRCRVSLRREPGRGFRAGSCGCAAQGRGEERHKTLPAYLPADRALLAAGAGMVPCL